MKVKKAIKKMVALSSGGLMVGATMFGAMAAADLSTYPAPFVEDGAFNSLIVVGEAAATQDVLGAIDIATSLQYASKTTTIVNTGTASTTSATGDAKKIEMSTNKLEINETISGIMESVTSSDLDALSDEIISNEYGDFTYTQTIYIPDGASRIRFVADPDDDDSVAAPYFYIPNGQSVYRYKLAFTPALKSDHSTATGIGLEDIRNKKLSMLGKEYTILKAAHADANETALTLMAGAVSDILEEGASKTYTVGGNDYDITLDYVGTAEAKFTVNSEVTDSLAEGDTYKLADGSEIGIVDILAQEFAGGLRKVDFNLGASKIKIDDTDTSSNSGSTWGATVTVSTEDMSQLKGDIKTSVDGGTAHGCDVQITSIELNYTAGDDLYIPVGGSVSAVADEKEGQDGNFIAGAFDFTFQGLQIGKTEEIELIPTGSNNYKIKFTNKGGIEYSQSIVACNDTTNEGQFHLGRYSGSTMYDLVTDETLATAKNEYFFVEKSQYSHILQFKTVKPGSSASDGTGTVTVKDVGSGDLHEVTYTNMSSNLQADLNLDGNTFKLNVSSDTTSATLSNIDFNGDGDYSDTNQWPRLFTQYGALINLTEDSNTTVVRITAEEDEDNARDIIKINFTESGDNKIDIQGYAAVTVTGAYPAGPGYADNLQLSEDGAYLYKWYSNYGMFVELDEVGSGNTQNSFKVIYPDEQVFGAFFVEGASAAYTTATGAGTVESTSVTRIDVGAAVLDTDPAVDGKETEKNLIVVGGPAINRAAAVLLGVPFPSYGAASTVPENAAIIKLVEQTDGNVALIVAGWTAEDSQRASRVVADFETYQEAGTLTGTEVQVSGTSLTDITVGAVEVVEEEEEVVEEEAAEEVVEEEAAEE